MRWFSTALIWAALLLFAACGSSKGNATPSGSGSQARPATGKDKAGDKGKAKTDKAAARPGGDDWGAGDVEPGGDDWAGEGNDELGAVPGGDEWAGEGEPGSDWAGDQPGGDEWAGEGGEPGGDQWANQGAAAPQPRARQGGGGGGAGQRSTMGLPCVVGDSTCGWSTLGQTVCCAGPDGRHGSCQTPVTCNLR